MDALVIARRKASLARAKARVLEAERTLIAARLQVAYLELGGETADSEAYVRLQDELDAMGRFVRDQHALADSAAVECQAIERSQQAAREVVPA
jgi:hypothetical protein